MDENIQNEPKIRTAGEMLQQARENLGLSISDVSSKLNLRPGLVRDLEENRFTSKLSVDTFIRGYIRSYAKLVKISGDEVISAYEEMIGIKETIRQEEEAKRIRAEDSKRCKRIFIASLISLAILGAISSLVYFCINLSDDVIKENDIVISSSSSTTLPENQVREIEVNKDDTDIEVASLPISEEPLYVNKGEVLEQVANRSEDIKQKEFEAMQQAVKDGKKTDVAIQDTIITLDQDSSSNLIESNKAESKKVDVVKNIAKSEVAKESKNNNSVKNSKQLEPVKKQSSAQNDDAVLSPANTESEELTGEEILITAQMEQNAYNEKHQNETVPINLNSENIQQNNEINNENEVVNKNSNAEDVNENVADAQVQAKQEKSTKSEEILKKVQLKNADTMKVSEAETYVLRFNFTGDCWIGLYQGEKTLVNHVYGKGGIAEITVNSMPVKLKIGAPTNISASVNGAQIDLSLARPDSPFRVDITN